MKKTFMFSFLCLFFLLIGCLKNNTSVNPPSNSTGGISFKIDPKSVPAGVTIISAALTRTGYTAITKDLNLLSDPTAEVSIPAVQIGTWHLKIDAKDNNGTILYTGETDVIVQENIVVQLNLTLNPVTSGTGTIYIFVTWGTNNSGQWTDYGGNPVLTRTNNPSLPNAISEGKIIYDNGIYKMWYCAIYNSAQTSIWYAESQNGINWNTIGSGPVLTKGTMGSWDDFSIVPSVVLKVNNQYRMYYMGCDDIYGTLSIGIALSTDGINWVKNPAPVIAANSQYYMIGLTEIVQRDSIYLAYFNYNSTRSASNNKIGRATSYDGINWIMYAGNPIMTATLPWEGGSIHHPSVIIDNNEYKMVYGNALLETSFGMATSIDGYNFTKQPLPFFNNTNSIKNYVIVAYPYFRKFNNEYRIYYTGQEASGELSINLLRIPN